MRDVKKIILLLTVVALGLSQISMAPVDIHKGEEAREENTSTRPPVQTEPPALVENSAEAVTTPPPAKTPSPVEPTPDPVEPEPAYTEEQLEILAIIIYQEAGGDACSDDTRRKVGSVFLNRVDSSLFPNTFEDVATMKGQYGELYWTGITWPKRASYDVEARAVERAYTIAEELLVEGGILPANVIWQAEFQQGDGVHCHQDGFYFCYSEVNE